MQQYEKTKKKRRLRLATAYVVMTIAVIVISTACILLVLGYSFNFTSRQVERGALLQFASEPTGASIKLDNEVLSFNTPGKENVSVGPHMVTFSKVGYRDWSKQFTVRPGEVRRLDYARLVPTTVETTSVREFAGLGEAMPSPNREWLTILPKNDTPLFVLADLRDAKKVKFTELSIPNEALTLPEGSAHAFRVVQWDSGSKYLLVRHDFGSNQSEFIRVNHEDKADIVNISSKFGVKLSEVYFSSNSIFYGLENNNLRRLDLGSSSLSEPLATSVVQIKLYAGKDISLVHHKDARVEVATLVDGKLRVAASYDDTVPVLIDSTVYFNDRYLAIARGSSFELIKNPHKNADEGLEKIVTLTYPIEIKWLDMSPTGRFVIAGNATQFMTYDIELAIRTSINLPNLTDVDPAKPLQWLDNYVLVSTADNKLRLSDFDGDNQQIITDSLPGQPVVLSANSKLIYSFSKTQTGQFTLNVSKMTVEN